ncbi:MAG: 4Fe-4S single cluster domain-containing protein [Acutalibacteraceae bacterium]
MYVARLLYPVNVLGPGKRIGIWFNGCNHHCLGCSNPELWEPQERYKTTLETIMQLISSVCATHSVDGFTLTGGDPFMQPDALKQLLPELSKITKDILVYTGFGYDEVLRAYPEIVSQIGVLIDGKYVQERNTGTILRGSDNQNIIVINSQLTDKYNRYLTTAQNEIQNFTAFDGVISVGIHKPEYENQVDTLLRGKGLENI